MLAPLFGFPLAAVALVLPVPTQMHIKIFPHLFDYLPEGKDADPAHVTLKSNSACDIFYGNPKSTASTGKLKSHVPSLNLVLTKAALSDPLWIQCGGEVTVIRKHDHANYFYSGAIYAHAVRTGPELIETISPNQYIKGVVPSEMPSTWPAEALKAQAVAARTYALYHVLQGRQRPSYAGFYDVDDTVLYQAYTGDVNRRPETDQAIDDTGSTLILYQGMVIQAYFSADASGYTEDASHVWPVTAPFCVAKPEIYTDPGLDNGEWGPWVEKFTMDEVDEKLQAAGLIPAGSKIETLQVNDDDRYVSGRAHVVTATLVDGVTTDIDALRFRRELGLKSTLFTISQTTNGLEIHGRGFGHGAGMSQFGARLLADLGGWDYQRILNFYYTDVVVKDPSASSNPTNN